MHTPESQERPSPILRHPAAPSDDLPMPQAFSSHGKRILVVDDSTVSRLQIQHLLGKNGYQVLESRSGEECLAIAPLANPDLVLLDVMMDGIDGFETCRRLRAHPATQDLPIVFLTGKTGGDAVAKGLEAGANDYIHKPFHPRECLSRVETQLRFRALVEWQRNSIQVLQQANTAKDTLIRISSHDLRNPVCAIQGLAELLAESMGNRMSEEEQTIIRSIRDASDSLLTILNDLLDSSIINPLAMEPERSPTDLNTVGEDITWLYSAKAAEKRLLLRFHPAPGLPRLLLDPDQIRRVLDNLLSNAIKFSPADRQVDLRVLESGETVIIQVDDQGPGIPESEHHLLFREFGKTSVRPTFGEKSTGLGLSICRRIVEGHKGTILMQNLSGRGARFEVRLPRVPVLEGIE